MAGLTIKVALETKECKMKTYSMKEWVGNSETGLGSTAN